MKRKPRNWVARLLLEIKPKSGAHGKSLKALRRSENMKLKKQDYSVMRYEENSSMANVPGMVLYRITL